MATYNSRVSKNKPGAYRTISDALAAAPTNSNAKYLIHVEAGVSEERVTVGKNLTNIVLVGDGALTTIIRAKQQAVNKTSQTGTITVLGDGFIAKNIQFENYAGDGGEPRGVLPMHIHGVSIHSIRRIGYSCDIHGTVTSYSDTRLMCFNPATCNRTITFTAQNKDGGSTEAQADGGAEHLGRPWSVFSTVVVMESYLEKIIQPAIWNWNPI